MTGSGKRQRGTVSPVFTPLLMDDPAANSAPDYLGLRLSPLTIPDPGGPAAHVPHDVCQLGNRPLAL